MGGGGGGGNVGGGIGRVPVLKKCNHIKKQASHSGRRSLRDLYEQM